MSAGASTDTKKRVSRGSDQRYPYLILASSVPMTRQPFPYQFTGRPRFQPVASDLLRTSTDLTEILPAPNRSLPPRRLTDHTCGLVLGDGEMASLGGESQSCRHGGLCPLPSTLLLPKPFGQITPKYTIFSPQEVRMNRKGKRKSRRSARSPRGSSTMSQYFKSTLHRNSVHITRSAKLRLFRESNSTAGAIQHHLQQGRLVS